MGPYLPRERTFARRPAYTGRVALIFTGQCPFLGRCARLPCPEASVNALAPTVVIYHAAMSALDVAHGAVDPLIVARIGEPFRLAYTHVGVV